MHCTRVLERVGTAGGLALVGADQDFTYGTSC